MKKHLKAFKPRGIVAMEGVGKVPIQAENTHFFENLVRYKIGNTDDLGVMCPGK